ncbi:MAG: tRNA (guanosine(37)-N1)-methyltransferase TrmD [Bacteroidales bacterium]|nr:tRNA (guanosine(37)-N1)-methyltransferase TrmD [Bacteroidales bacterium]
MRIDIITVLPEILSGPFDHSIIKRARNKKLVEIFIHNLRDYSENKHRRVDDYSYSKGPGMVMSVQPIEKAINILKEEREYDEIIFTAPDGQIFDQKEANNLSMKNNIIILCGHYKGVDQRVRDHFITKEISIGDYVLTGGELAAAVITDSIVRLLPGVISDETSALSDSFQDNLLSPPVYTRPSDYKGMKVPEILLSGNDNLIDEWKYRQAVERTKKLRPDLYQKYLNTKI